MVRLDGLPVPAEYLRIMAGPGVVVDKDGVVSFFASGYLKYGNKTVEGQTPPSWWKADVAASWARPAEASR